MPTHKALPTRTRKKDRRGAQGTPGPRRVWRNSDPAKIGQKIERVPPPKKPKRLRVLGEMPSHAGYRLKRPHRSTRWWVWLLLTPGILLGLLAGIWLVVFLAAKFDWADVWDWQNTVGGMPLLYVSGFFAIVADVWRRIRARI